MMNLYEHDLLSLGGAERENELEFLSRGSAEREPDFLKSIMCRFVCLIGVFFCRVADS